MGNYDAFWLKNIPHLLIHVFASESWRMRAQERENVVERRERVLPLPAGAALG